MTTGSRPLRGCQEELAVIERRLREATAGTGGAVVVEGSAGVGKTKLIEMVSIEVDQVEFAERQHHVKPRERTKEYNR